MVLSIGEILVDIFLDGDNKSVYPGGAPFNLACNIAHFNGDVAFYGSVGDDEYGHFLKGVSSNKLKHVYLDVLKDRDTSEAIVTIKDGERSFRFNRLEGADYILDSSSLDRFDIKNINIIHIGSLMLSFKEGKEFFKNVINKIKNESNALISFDVNYRDDIFDNEEQAKKTFLEALKLVDIIKFTEEELSLLSGKNDIKEGLDSLVNDKQIAVVTLGKDGSIFYSVNRFIKVGTYPLKPMDTTGAGDAFYSYFLYALDKGLDLDNDEDVKNALLRANVVGGLTTQKKGAIDSAPNLEEIESFIKEHR